MANYTNRGSHYKAASREEKRRPWRKKGLAVLACLLAVAFAAGVAALAVPGLFRSGGEVTLEKTIYWWDNDNEGNPRPTVDKYEKPLLVLKDENGNQYMSDNDDEQALALLKSLGYPDGWPEVAVTPGANNTWKVTTSPESLNKIVYEVDEDGEPIEGEDGNPVPTGETVTWSLSQDIPPEVEGYTAIYADLAESLGDLFGSFSEVKKDEWHYVKNADYTFTIDLRSGSLENLSGITQEILKQFELEASFTTKDGKPQSAHASLADLQAEPGYAEVAFELWDEEKEEWVPLDESKIYGELRLSLTMPKYTIEGQPITYKVAEADENKNNRLEYQIPDFEGTDDKDDYFAIKYDDTNATNHGSATDGAYSGGSVILTLTGTTKYEATKVWQDKDRDENTARPNVTLELWRYVAGQPLESAAAVRDSQGNIYTYDVSEKTASGEEMTVTFHDKDAEGQPLEDPADFPKYDPEGNRYIYVVKEYGLSGNYTQVFGEVDSNGDVSGDFIKEDQDEDGVVDNNYGGRESGNTYLYNGGTLNNVFNGTTTATATKVWNASAFQAEFGGVKVELTLQSCPAGTENWENVLGDDGEKVTRLLDGFQAENLAGLSYSGAFPQYDNLGRELEYRWVETGVTQDGFAGVNFNKDEGTFTLQQTDSTGQEREVQYTSVSKGPDEEGNTTITNSVANTVEYEVDKWWALTEEEVEELADKLVSDKENYYQNENGQWYTKDIGADDSTIKDDNAKSATFYLYRVESGEQVPMDEPGGYYLGFTMTKDGVTFFADPGTITDEELKNIEITETGEENPWHVNITGLPEFDEGGRQYDYVLVEANASPRYEMTRESEGYSTTVYNPRGPGEVLQILVQKNWIDDSDTVHREPVVIQAYDKNTGDPIENASVKLKNGLWYDWITIQLGSSVGDGNNTEQGEENETFETIETDETIEDGEIDKGGEPTQSDDGTGDEVQTGGETETDGNTDVTTQPGEENDETEEITNTDSDTPEESEVSESLLANEGKALAAPKTGDGEGEIQDPLNENESDNLSENESKTPGDAGNTKPDGVQSIDDIYLLEYSIGEVPVTNTLKDGDIDDGIDEINGLWYDRVTGDVTSQYHRYQVTYSDFTSIEGSEYKYSATVTNRRLGNIDITVHKVWNSGDGSEADALRQELQRAQIPGATEQGASLALRLTFHESMGEDHGYTIEDGYVTLGNGAEKTTIYNVARKVKDDSGNPVSSDDSFDPGTDPGSSVIEIDFPSESGAGGEVAGKDQTYYFSNLPKYDTTGTIVRYTVEEGLVSEDGTFISFEDYIKEKGPEDALAKELKKWVHTMEEGEYVTALDPNEALPQVSTKDVDFQEFKATNSLTGTKDVRWYKEWNDAYRNQEGERPDIFLDVFRLVHEDDETTRLELVVKDYQWTPTEGKDAVNNWTATMEGVPLYDRLGYKITYFAVERAVGDTERFDYGPVRYYNTKGDLMGDRLEVKDEYLTPTPDGEQYACSLKNGDDYVEVANMGDETLADRYRDRTVNYALGEGGTFENYLRADPNLAGSKLWQGVESGYPTDQLPQVTFALYRKMADAKPDDSGEVTEPEEVATLQVNWGGDSGMLNGSLTTDFRFFMLGDWKVDWEDTHYVYTYVGEDPAPETRTYYVNDKWQVVDGTTGEEIELPDNVRLPQYDEKGNRYAYTMVEKSITMMGPNGKDKITIKLDPDGTPSEDNEEKAVAFYESIFTDAKMTEGTFQATNVYNDEQNGQLAVEKWLNVGETKPEGYPAIRVKLYRAVTSQKDNADAWRLVDSHIWGSDTVEKAFTEDNEGWAHLTHTFENLPIYAPNGEKYVYKVVEVKENFLDGYDTWAVKGTVEKGDLNEKTNKDNLGEVVSDLEAMKVTEGTETTPDTATFINKRDAGGVKLQGTKVWDDWSNEMDLRPSDAENVITLEVTRHAESQPGMNNPIELQALDKNSYEVEWTISDSGDTWTYTITGKDGGELERYAPNGMPWIYQVTETIEGEIVGVYVATPGTATFEPGETTGQLDAATDLKNSLKTSAAFQKKWVGDDGESISTDYFGKVTVDYKLQVAFDNDNGTVEWKDAETFFTNDTAQDGQVSVPSSVLNMGTYQFEGSTNEANGWKGTFSGLPRAVKVGEETKILTYRVVETKVTYTLPGEEDATEVTVTPPDGTGQNYELSSTDGAFTSAVLTSNIITTNTMKTVDLEIRKIWEDQNNKYGTRPEGGSDGTWKVDFIIQYQDPKDVETGEYHNVTTKDGEPLIVSISDVDTEDQGTTTVKDLPFVAGRQYYAFELEPGHEAADEGPEGFRVTSSDEAGPGYYHHNMYDASDEHELKENGDCTSTVTNTLRTTQVTAVKKWEPEGLDNYPQVTLQLQYQAGTDENDNEIWENMGAPVTLPRTEGEGNEWEYTWENIPLYHPDDPSIETGETTYRVVELDGDGYVQKDVKVDEENKTFTFTNKPVVDFTVEKKWDQPPAGYENWKVTVQLYRATEDDPTGEEYENPITLTAAGGWKYTWNDLDKYYEDDGEYKEYTYYVREVSISDGGEINPLTEQGTIQVGDTEFVVSYDTNKTNTAINTTITNRPVGTCSVEKVWWNEGGTTPVSVTVGLYQETDDGIEPVKDKDSNPITITLPYEGKWSHTWTDLYKYDADGTAIRYVVRELDEDGNPVSNGDSVTVDGTDYTVYYDGFTIHNVREETLTIEKTVTGDAADPERKFTFKVGFTYDEDMPAGSTGPYAYTVYQKGDGDEPEQVSEGTISSNGGTISLTGGQRAVIEGLPAGTEYTVTEREANQDGYVTTPTDGKVEGTITVGEENKASFTNHRAPGHLIIRKEVTGSRGDQNKQWEFHLKADLLEGMPYWGSSVGYRSDGSQVDLVFHAEDGYATFTLKSGESLEIKDFPIGTVFTVTEEGANEGGYTTTVKGNGTAVPDGMEVKLEYDVTSTVTFTNHKPGGGGPGPGPTPTPTPEPEETPTPEPGESPTPAPEGSPSPEPSGTPGPDGTPTPAPSGSPSPSGSPTPGPGGSPTPAPTPTPPGGDTPDDTPQTGDPTHTLWWALAGAGALAGLGALWATRPKGHKARHRKK